MLHEKTFSDWSEDSELRMLEKRGLDQWQQIGPLFSLGLTFSQQAYERTNGAFDISVGDRQWLGALRSKGMGGLERRNVEGREEFRFANGVERLTFGGIAKGMALGDIAHFLKSEDIEDFSVDAGGGNIVQASSKNVVFLSRSRVAKSGSSSEAHVLSPKGSKLELNKSVEISCTLKWGDRPEMLRWGALIDAYSTALLVDQGRNWELPKECQSF